MRTFLSGRSTFGRLVARLIVWALITGQVMLPVQAAPTALADVPIAAKVTAKPNIVYTLDDSGSMQNNFLPDYVTNVGATITIYDHAGRHGCDGIRRGQRARGRRLRQHRRRRAARVQRLLPDHREADGDDVQVHDDARRRPCRPPRSPPGYGSIQVVTSSAYCRSGNNTTPCTAQAQNIGSTVVGLAVRDATGGGPGRRHVGHGHGHGGEPRRGEYRRHAADPGRHRHVRALQRLVRRHQDQPDDVHVRHHADVDDAGGDVADEAVRAGRRVVRGTSAARVRLQPAGLQPGGHVPAADPRHRLADDDVLHGRQRQLRHHERPLQLGVGRARSVLSRTSRPARRCGPPTRRTISGSR